MIIVRTPEDSAKLILAIFKGGNARAGEILMSAAVNKQLLLGGGRVADYKAGLEFAYKQGWITIEPTMLRLTEVGHTVM